jgi:hypothetical protein
MRRGFLYGTHSSKIDISASDAAIMRQLGHNAHVRIIDQPLLPHELHCEMQNFHYLTHYGIQVLADIASNPDAHRIAQHLREIVDIFIINDTKNLFVIDHADEGEADDIRANRIRTALRSIEASQERGLGIRGYFCGEFNSLVQPSDTVFQAIIQQAQSVVI